MSLSAVYTGSLLGEVIDTPCLVNTQSLCVENIKLEHEPFEPEDLVCDSILLGLQANKYVQPVCNEEDVRDL